jgi:guanylate kinase
MNMKEKVIILGKSGSGKNFLMNGLVSLGLKPCIKTTTRPKRRNELDNIDYNFLTKEEFLFKLSLNEMLLYEKFEVEPKYSEKEIWYYGIEKEIYINSDVVILTPNEYNIIVNNKDRSEYFVIYLDIDRNIRKDRINLRNDTNDSINRRLDSDDEDFRKFNDYDLRITDPDFSSEDVYSLIEF